MPPVQTTFELVPNGPAGLLNGGAAAATNPDSPAPKPPMTTKQAQKLYKQANRAPRMSRAEQRAQERAEQERIRKEFEKEKAAAKAKSARERKRAKEEAIKEEKKRRGEPTVHVRPSQGMISGFVRLGKKQDVKNEVDEKKTDDRNNDNENAVEDRQQTAVDDLALQPIAFSETNAAAERSSMPTCDPPQSTRSSENSLYQRAQVPKLVSMGPPPARTPFQEKPVNAPQRPAANMCFKSATGSMTKPGDMRPPPPPRFKPRHVPSSNARPTFATANLQKQEPLTAHPSITRERPRAMEDPFALPSSTQMLILNHVDDLFPSSSQQALELIEYDDSRPRMVAPSEDTPENHSRAAFQPPPPHKDNDLPPDEFPFFSTQDFFLSSQDVRELENAASASEQEEIHYKPPIRLSPICEEEGSEHEAPNSSKASQQTPKHTSTRKRLLHRSSPTSPASPALPPQVRTQNSAKDDAEEAEDSTSTTSPPKKRFFTSSGSEALYLAMEKSRQTYQREERERELVRQVEQARREQQLVQPAQLPPAIARENPRACSYKDRPNVATGPPSMPVSDMATGPGTTRPAAVESKCASQETDYGEFDIEDCSALLDGITEEDLMIDDDDL